LPRSLYLHTHTGKRQGALVDACCDVEPAGGGGASRAVQLRGSRPKSPRREGGPHAEARLSGVSRIDLASSPHARRRCSLLPRPPRRGASGRGARAGRSNLAAAAKSCQEAHGQTTRCSRGCLLRCNMYQLFILYNSCICIYIQY
jgi:hypothetical protein